MVEEREEEKLVTKAIPTDLSEEEGENPAVSGIRIAHQSNFHFSFHFTAETQRTQRFRREIIANLSVLARIAVIFFFSPCLLSGLRVSAVEKSVRESSKSGKK